MRSKIVYGKFLLADADTCISSGALYVEGDTIRELGTYEEITGRYRADELIGSSEHLVTPGFINAHGHGKGITDFQRGAIDDTLETWKFRSFPEVDIHYDTLWTAVRLLESGVTATMHNHNLVNPEAWEEELPAAIEAYRESGIRLAFAPTLINQNHFIYGDNEAFIRTLPAEQASLCREILSRMGRFSEKEYFRAVEALSRSYRSEQIKILHGPLAPQWVTDEALLEVKSQAERLDMRIHIHTLQTRLQKLYGLKRYGKSLLAHLRDLGFLSRRVTCGHCVWLTEDDIRLLAETGASATHHPACNLRVRNGIAPVFEMLAKGIRVGIGMDEKELGDDKDFIEEMRLASKLHRLPSHRLDSPHLLPREVFRMGTENGAAVIGFSGLAGTLKPGKRADVVLLNMGRMSEPYVNPAHRPVDLLIYRGRGCDVDTVLVGGEVLLKEGKLTRLDRHEIVRKLRESIPERYAEEYRRRNAPFGALRREIARYFDPWYEELAGLEAKPFYHLNNRV